jgi:hypothetical protein
LEVERHGRAIEKKKSLLPAALIAQKTKSRSGRRARAALTLSSFFTIICEFFERRLTLASVSDRTLNV